jgi:SAM-dependent methyltransferase
VTVARRPTPRYPIEPAPNVVDRVLVRVGSLAPIRCPVCGRFSAAVGFSENLRESGLCRRCGSTNRQRQMAMIACRAAAEIEGQTIRALPELARLPLALYNTEAQGPLHEQLRHMDRYACSEYLAPGLVSGDVVDGTMHQDLMDLSFDDGSIDIVLSSDVFEHVPDPYAAHVELFRVLRPNGRHVFTVPFHQHLHLDERRARPGATGDPELLAPAIYHDDPVRLDGALVYTIFGLEMLVRLAEIGFSTRMYRLWAPHAGIVGSNALVFEAVKG